MAFDVLSDFTLTSTPVPETGAGGLPLLGVAAQPLVDGAGASMTGTIGPGGTTITYTAQDGTETESNIDVRDNFSLASETGLPFGDTPGLFIFPIAQQIPGGELGDSVGLFAVQVGQDGTVMSTVSTTEAFEPETFEGFGDLDLFPLGDGRLGYAFDGLFTNAVTEVGVVELDEDTGLTVQPLATFASGTEVTGLALDDGGVLIAALPAGYGSPVDVVLTQYDADGTAVAAEQLGTADYEGLGIEPEGSFTTLDLDENGDLVVYVEDLDSDPARVFEATLDLLPETDVPAEPTEGDDLLDLTAADDMVDALGGDDTVFGRGGVDDIIGGAGDDDLRGGADSDFIYAETTEVDSGDPEGTNFLRGNAGDDGLYGGAGADDMNGGFGSDEMFGGSGDDRLGGFDGDDVIFGDAGNDQIHGGDGNDQLFGDDGDDVMRGADGDDFMLGGAGNDILVGGAGADEFLIEVGYGAQDDLIKDFAQGEDTLTILGEIDGETITFEDLFLSQEKSVAIIQAGDSTIRLKGVDVDDLDEEDLLLF